MATMHTSHVGLSVTDLRRSVDFYTSVLGFEAVTADEPPAAFLSRDGELMVTLWEQSRSEYDAGHAGIHHLAFSLGAREEVDEIESRARAAGASFIYDGPVSHREGSASGGIFFEDPDGIRIEVGASSGFENAPVPVPGKPACGIF